MKKVLMLFCAAIMAACFAQETQAQSYQTECISVEQDGSQTLRVFGKGRNRSDAIEQAKKDAVYEVLFKGVLKGNKGYNLRPVVTEVNARERYQDYFDIFFMDGGEYLKYVSMADRRLGSTKKVKNSDTQVGYLVTVRVLIPELRVRLKQDGIIKTQE
jgi:hypothetical protein